MKQKSVMHNFAQNPSVNLPRSKFKMPFGHKTTGDAGWLIPIYWQMVLPGDTLNVNPTLFARLATPQFPIMDNMMLDIQHFFCPTRLTWENYRKFHGEQENPGDSISFNMPQLSGLRDSDADGSLAGAAGRTGRLLNYLGVPEGIDATDVGINCELLRVYNKIYNHWYRSQSLINSLTENIDDGPDADTDYELRRRGKRFDYFTQGLPSPQRGSAVSLPLGTTAPLTITDDGNPIIFDEDGAGSGPTNIRRSAATAFNTAQWEDVGVAGATNMYYGDQGLGGTADLSSATAATINDLRESFQVQRLLERDARSGTRLPEVLRGHFGVTDFYDASYRPEFLGGGSTPVNVNALYQTGPSGAFGVGEGIGGFGGFGQVVSNGNGFTKSFTEHGVVMSIISVRADLTYQQGLNRFFSHQTRYDTAYPVLSGLGEQAILSKEIYCDGTAGDDDVFSYVPRYDEYRYNISRISGKFLSASATPLDAWHLSQEFSSRPTLSESFIQEDPPIDRVIAVPSEPHFIFDTYFDVTCARVLPTFGIPGRIDHF